MPLYNFRCEKCNILFERFLHDSTQTVECEKCKEKCNKVFGKIHSRKRLDAKEILSELIEPDAKRISKNISEGSDKDFLDICGES